MVDAMDAMKEHCLEENTLEALGSGRLTAAERDRAARHLDGCDDCRELLAALGRAARSTGAEAPPVGTAGADTAPTRLAAGARIGRYTVLHEIGAGSMGVVYAAYDPELDRRVALKLVQHSLLTSASHEEAASRLLREAQALARLSHPHVITVFDAGRFEGQVFLAMEFVEGGTLGAWMRASSRTPDAVLEIFLAAGRGLAAAHAAGLIHRDFKPDNVLVGKDGRARVTDFGLALLAEAGAVEPDEQDTWARPLPASAHFTTRTGALLGTPAYMAPELFRGAQSNTMSDQFAYCVALYEALHGERPFKATELRDDSLESKEPATPRSARVPVRVQRVLGRGLSLRPEHRFRSMDALLDQLEQGKGARRRWLFVLASAVGLAALLASALVPRWSRAAQPVCAHAEDRLRGAWDDARREQVRAAYLKTGVPHAQATWTATARLLDRYSMDWAEVYTQACEATQVRGEQSGELLDLRMACLGQRRESLSALTTLLAGADEEVVGQAVQAVAALPSLDECSSLPALTSPLRLPADPTARARIEAVRTELAEAGAELAAGRFERSRTLSEKAAGEAATLAYRPLEAEASLGVALVHIRMENGAEAEPALHRALQAAEASGHLAIAARVELSLAHLQGMMLRRHEQGHFWVDLAGATLERIGGAPQISADRLFVLGDLLRDEGRAGESALSFEKALSLQEAALGPDHPNVALTQARLAMTLATLERYPEALTFAQRSLSTAERLLGPDHPDLSKSLQSMAFILFVSGHYAEGIPFMERDLVIKTRAFGPGHPALVKTLINLSNVQDDPRKAIAWLERARDLQERRLGLSHPDGAMILKNLAISHGLLHQYREELAYAERALPIEEKLLGPEHPDLVETLSQIGRAHDKLGAPARGLPFLERALVIAESRPFTDSYAAGRATQVQLRRWLSEVIWQLGRDRARARTLMLGALDLARAGGADMALVQGEVESWLSGHRLP